MTPQDLHMEAYKILVSMLQKDDELFWKRNDVLIAINGGLLTIVGFLQSSDNVESLKAISCAICLIGFASCVFWFLIAKRGVAFYDHWYEQLKYIENQYLNPIQIFNTADLYFEKGYIKLGNKELSLNRWARLKMFSAMQFLALFFCVVWICLGLYLLIFAS